MTLNTTKIDEKQIENLSVSAIDDYWVINRNAGVMFTTPVVTAVGLTVYAPEITACIYDNQTFSGFPVVRIIQAANFVCVDEAVNYLYVDYNDGDPVYHIDTEIPLGAFSDKIPVNTILATNGYLHLSHWDNVADGLPDKIHKRLVNTQRYAWASGLELSLNGSIVRIHEGVAWRGAREFILDDVYSNGTNFSTWFFYHTTASGWEQDTPASGVNFTQYDTGAGLATLSNNFYNINWFFRGIEDHQHGYYILSDKEYKDFPAALAENVVPSPPLAISSHAILVGRMIFKKGISTPEAIEGAFDTLFSGAVINDHNALGGLQGGVAEEYYHLSEDDFNNLTSDSPTFNSIQFDTTPTVSGHQEGLLHWDSDSGTLELDLAVSGTKLQIGQEILIKVYNQSGVDIPNGSAVYISGSNGEKPLISLANSTDEDKSSKVIGVTTTEVLNGGNNFGYVTTQGLIHDLNTESLTGGTILWLGTTPGSLTSIKPIAPQHAVYIGVVIKQHGVDGVIYVNPINGFEVSELHDVLIQNIADNDILVWNAASGIFVNSNALSGKQPYHGFVDRVSSTISFNNTTTTFTISGSNYNVYINGELLNFTGPVTANLSTSPEWGDGVSSPLGQWFIWFNSNGTLGFSKTPWDILGLNIIPVATVYIQPDGVGGFQGFVSEERHSYKRNLEWHEAAHFAYGTQYRSGFTPIPTFLDNNTFSFTGGLIADEDIVNSSEGTRTSCNIGYKKTTTGPSGSTTILNFDPSGSTFVKTAVNGQAYYDNNTTLTALGANKYCSYWIYATNRTVSPIVSIMGQAVYDSAGAAGNDPYPNLGGLSVAEWKLIYKIILRGANSSFSVNSITPLYNQSTGPVILATPPVQIAATNVSLLTSANITATNVQDGIQELADKFDSVSTSGFATIDHTHVVSAVSGLQMLLDGKQNTIPASSTNNWDSAYAHSVSTHAPTGAEANYTAATSAQAEDSAGTTLLSWTSQRIWQAITKWGSTITSVFSGVFNGTIQGAKGKKVNFAPTNGQTVTIDYAVTDLAYIDLTSITTGSSVTISISGAPTSADLGALSIAVKTAATLGTITSWPTGTLTPVPVPAVSKTTLYGFTSIDGVNWIWKEVSSY